MNRNSVAGRLRLPSASRTHSIAHPQYRGRHSESACYFAIPSSAVVHGLWDLRLEFETENRDDHRESVPGVPMDARKQ